MNIIVGGVTYVRTVWQVFSALLAVENKTTVIDCMREGAIVPVVHNISNEPCDSMIIKKMIYYKGSRMDVPVAIQVLNVDDDMVMSFVPVWPTY